MNKLLFVLLISILAGGLATAQKPVVYDVSNVVVGAQRIPTLALFASGKWSTAGESTGTLSAEIHCYKSLGFCDVADAFTTASSANVAGFL